MMQAKCNTLTNADVIHIMTLTVRLTNTLDNQLTRYREANSLSKPQVVQNVLKDWFAKPSDTTAHPLLSYVQAAANATPSEHWAGAYSKDALCARVLAGGSVHSVHEPEA